MKKYKEFLLETISTLEEVKSWCEKLKLRKFKINKDLTVDVNGDVELLRMDLTEIPIQFGKVKGDFDCSFNKLQSLRGCPRIVERDFDFMYNNIRNIDFFPEKIGGEITANNNDLQSLNGIPYDIHPDNIFYNLGNDSIEVDSWWIEKLKRHPIEVLRIKEHHKVSADIIDEYKGIISAHRDFDMFDD